MRENPHKLLAVNMRGLRAERGWSQEELAFQCSLHRTYIGAVERLEKNPSLASIARIASAFGVHTWELLYPGETK